MRIIRTLDEWRALRATLSGPVGFVPTMGALHAGHASLLERSVRENTHTVLSIYVNPTQFNNAEDLASYPDTLDADLALARSLGVDTVLLPAFAELYADDYRYQVREQQESNALCGAHRPGHFDGVLTVVLKLLNVIQPANAYFGEKDYQQYELVRDMCAAFFVPVNIVPCETVREADGLALSSRNLRLTAQDRRRATAFPKALRAPVSDAQVIAQLRSLGFDVDYVETRGGRRYGAASLGSGANTVRLIDNVPVPVLAEAS
ncbi:MAG: pantoate--beta-alanine ligase [Pseudomonadota bacterium]